MISKLVYIFKTNFVKDIVIVEFFKFICGRVYEKLYEYVNREKTKYKNHGVHYLFPFISLFQAPQLSSQNESHPRYDISLGCGFRISISPGRHWDLRTVHTSGSNFFHRCERFTRGRVQCSIHNQFISHRGCVICHSCENISLGFDWDIFWAYLV